MLKQLFVIAAVALLFCQSAPGFAAPLDELVTIEQIDKLTKQILLKEIALERFTLHYTLEAAKQGRWKGWRYALMQEANNSLNLTGGIMSTWNRARVLHHPENLNVKYQETANHVPMIGAIIGASAAASEFGVNVYHDLIARKHGFSPAASLKYVKSVKAEVESLILERQKLVDKAATDAYLNQYVQVFNVEGKILQDMLDQSLREFRSYHVGARRLLAFQQSQYLFDVARYTTNAIGFHFAFLSLNRHQRIWNGRAGVLFAVTGQLTMMAPILSRFVGYEVALLTRRKLKKSLPEMQDANLATFQSNLAALDKLVKEKTSADLAVASVTERQAIFDIHQRQFANVIQSEEKKAAAAKLSATENIAAGAFVGGDKMVSSVLFLVPGYDNRYNSKTARAGRVTNDMLFTAAVVGIPANSFALLDTLRIQVRGELQRHKALKAGKLPRQVVAKRLKELDDIENALKGN